MKHFFIVLFFWGFVLPIVAQEPESKIPVDSLYREDQFYLGVTYNLLSNIPSGVSQSGFSSGFQIGFIRDMPLNKRRNFALGLGIGYSLNSFNHNIQITKTNTDYSYGLVDNDAFTKNKLYQHLLELPFEVRFRNSTPTEHKFFRVHTGFKVGYLFANHSKFKSDAGNESHSGIDDLNDLQFSLTFSIGYNTWNFYFQYGLNPIFNSSAILDGAPIDMSTTKIGLIFYVL